jgi:hypothetical protein
MRAFRDHRPAGASVSKAPSSSIARHEIRRALRVMQVRNAVLAKRSACGLSETRHAPGSSARGERA